MTIFGTCGNQVVKTLGELLHLLRESRTGVYGEFWIGEKEQSTLVIHINGDFAYLHYFPLGRHPGFQPIGNLDLKGDILFKQEGEADLLMPKSVVVVVEKAYEAAAEFFADQNLPSCISWAELQATGHYPQT